MILVSLWTELIHYILVLYREDISKVHTILVIWAFVYKKGPAWAGRY
jgi:hypothetical protein